MAPVDWGCTYGFSEVAVLKGEMLLLTSNSAMRARRENFISFFVFCSQGKMEI